MREQYRIIHIKKMSHVQLFHHFHRMFFRCFLTLDHHTVPGNQAARIRRFRGPKVLLSLLHPCKNNRNAHGRKG